ncbi:hypothetical protein BDW74DRAFT_14195 [Aspergillus multicolor]|uniref:uncharacterized protein n=1 Tax=Aspergillus multicolor TaxID=41759 RepID=UPI003CCCEBAC
MNGQNEELERHEYRKYACINRSSLCHRDPQGQHMIVPSQRAPSISGSRKGLLRCMVGGSWTAVACRVTCGLVRALRAVSALAPSLNKLTVTSTEHPAGQVRAQNRTNHEVTLKSHSTIVLPELFLRYSSSDTGLRGRFIRKRRNRCPAMIDRICRLLNLVGLGLCSHAFAGQKRQKDPPFRVFVMPQLQAVG